MDENKILKLRVIERTEKMLDEAVEKQAKPRVTHPNQTNPIHKKMLQFHNEKIGEKFSVKDLFW